MPKLRDNFGSFEIPSPRWYNAVARILNGVRSLSPFLNVETRADGEGIDFDLYDQVPGASMFPHPWTVAITGSGATLAYSCTNGIPGASYAGCVWTREGKRLPVDKVGPVAISATRTVCCKVTIPNAGGTPSAEIVEITGAVNYWQHAASEGVIKHFPLAIVTVAAGVATVEQLRFSDIDAGAGINVNDDAISLLSDGTTEFLVLTQQGAAGATAAAKLRKLTVQIDHGRVIRWVWGTPATAVGATASTKTVYGRVTWDATNHKLVQATTIERWENGVKLEETAGDPVDIVSFNEYVPCSGS